MGVEGYDPKANRTTHLHQHHHHKHKRSAGGTGSSNRGASPQPPTPTPQAVTAGLPAHAIKISSDQALPSSSVTGWPPCTDMGGQRVFLGLIPYENTLQPCKVVEGFVPPARWGFAGGELLWDKDYYLVPFDGARMEWVSANHGVTPAGRRLVEGGRDIAGEPLYHAIGTVDGVRVPGKAGYHINGALLPFGGRETLAEYYEVLCWR